MKTLLYLVFLSIFLFSCKKEIAPIIPEPPITHNNTGATSFKEYTIRAGLQYCDKNSYLPVELNKLSFIVKFDSSAIYKTTLSSNQYDINKLYGFSDNGSTHHEYSARFGWNWSNGSLSLFAYTYNMGERSFKKLATIGIGEEIDCAITVESSRYIFSVNDKTDSMDRKSTTLRGKGYMLYPYFGGDEAAPHDIHIWIK
ncbi:MAG: hypothetical protein ABIR19_07085 [Ginsengibacter sp.]